MVTGAPTPVMIDSAPVEQWQPLTVRAGSLLELGYPGAGTRTYLLIMGGIDVPAVLGSAATFAPGELGGLTGRPLAAVMSSGCTGETLDRSTYPVTVVSAHRWSSAGCGRATPCASCRLPICKPTTSVASRRVTWPSVVSPWWMAGCCCGWPPPGIDSG